MNEQKSGPTPSAHKPVTLPKIIAPPPKPIPLPQALSNWMMEARGPAARAQTFEIA